VEGVGGSSMEVDEDAMRLEAGLARAKARAEMR
jgi:hypothetical protein